MMADKTEHTGAPAALYAAGDAGPALAPGEPPPLPPTATALASKAKDLLALRDALVDAASVGAGLWFSYLFVLLYLLIAVGGVTHRDLFLQSPVKLPFLNVDLPLLGFFVLGPAIFFIVHAYVLLHFVLLAGKVGDFDTELEEQITDGEVQRRLRRQLPRNIFVQFLAGSREVRTGRVGVLLQLIAQISLVIGPVALLVFFQLQFLPYHNEAISWWHRIAVLADIALLWTLWPSIARGETAGLAWRDLRRGKIVALALASFAPVLLVTAIATFPGEWLDDTLWNDGKHMPRRLALLHEVLVAGEVDFAVRKPKSLWSNRLVLPGFDVIDHVKFDSEAKIEALLETVSLGARHLEGAVLIGATLRKADFTAAQLQGAQLDMSDLRGAKFDCGNPRVEQQCASLQGASLFRAQLQGASLNMAQLQGASLNMAQLQGASLFRAQLQGASLNMASLQGASLNMAQLQGASLEVAQLKGASLYGAQLQGASLVVAQLQGASLEKVFSWRADARKAFWEDTRVVNPETGRKYGCRNDEWSTEWSTCNWSLESFNKLKETIAEQVPGGRERGDAVKSIEQRLDPEKPLHGEDEMANVWTGQAGSPRPKDVYEKRLAEILRETGCAAEGAPYVVRGLLVRLGGPLNPFDTRFASGTAHLVAITPATGPTPATFRGSPQPSALAAAFLDEEHCPGAHGLTDAEKGELKAIRDRSPP